MKANPALCIGTAQIGLNYGVTNKAGKVKEEEVRKILDKAKRAVLII